MLLTGIDVSDTDSNHLQVSGKGEKNFEDIVEQCVHVYNLVHILGPITTSPLPIPCPLYGCPI